MTDKFPGWRYGPKGEAEIFQCEADVPKGWTDNPNDFKKADDAEGNGQSGDAGAGSDGDTAFDRDAAIAKLKAAGIKANGRWSDAHLQDELAQLPA